MSDEEQLEEVCKLLENNFTAKNIFDVANLPDLLTSSINKNIAQVVRKNLTREDFYSISCLVEAVKEQSGKMENHPMFGWCICYRVKGTFTPSLDAYLTYMYRQAVNSKRRFHGCTDPLNSRHFLFYVTVIE